MKGLSGAVTALILVIASVVIALLVVGFAFGLFGSFTSQGTVQALGPAQLYIISQSSGDYQYSVQVTLYNSGGAKLTITSVTINGVPATILGGENTIAPGTQVLTFSVSAEQALNLQSGTQVQLELVLSNGVSVPVSAVVYSS